MKSYLPTPSPLPSALFNQKELKEKDPNAMETDEAGEKSALIEVSSASRASPTIIHGPLDKVHSILSGEMSIKLHLEFLYRNNNTDLLILKNTKVPNFCSNFRILSTLVIQRTIPQLHSLTLSKMLAPHPMNF